MKNIYDENYHEKENNLNEDVFVDLHPERKYLPAVVLACFTLLFIWAVAYNLMAFDKSHTKPDLVEEEKITNPYNEDRLIANGEFSSTLSTISIESSCLNVEVLHGDDPNKIKVECFGDEELSESIILNATNDTLFINADSSAWLFFDSSNKTNLIRISIPSHYNGDIICNIDTADIYADSFENANMTFNVESGNVYVECGKQIDAKVDIGNFEVYKVETLNGSVDVGDLKVGFVDSSINMIVDYGDITIDALNLKKDSQVEVDCGNVTINNAGNSKILTDVSLGDVSVSHNENEAMWNMHISVDCGDVLVY